MRPAGAKPGGRQIPRSILIGREEGIFDVLPQRVFDNLYRSGSENALVWNLLYPRLTPTLSLDRLLRLRPLWGSVLTPEEDRLRVFFWGYSASGERLEGLDEALHEVDGSGPATEVDLFLVGERNLIVVEAKNRSGLGQCGRYARGRCPEVHSEVLDSGGPCRYWHANEFRFDRWLDFGIPPSPGSPPPPCNRHYQLARTLLVGQALARSRELSLHLWLIVPRTRWRAAEKDWLDFTDRVRDEPLWRRCRVLAWEQLRRLSKV